MGLAAEVGAEMPSNFRRRPTDSKLPYLPPLMESRTSDVLIIGSLEYFRDEWEIYLIH